MKTLLKMSDIINELQNKVAALTQTVNQMISNSKSVPELTAQTNLETSSLIPVSRSGNSEKISVQQIINAAINGENDQIINVGSITLVDNYLTIDSISAKINNVNQSISAPTTLTIPYCATGLSRIDLIVYTNSNQIVRIAGNETAGSIIFTPTLPLENLLITQISVSDSSIGDPTDPVVGNSSYKGTINLTAPILTDGIGTTGDYYKVVQSGNYDFGNGPISLQGTDFIFYNGSTWELLANNVQLTPETYSSLVNNFTTEDDLSDSDKFNYLDSSDENKPKKTTWLNIKAKLTTVFNALFVPETRTLTIGGVTQDLSANRTFTVSGGKRTVNYTYEFNGVLNTATNNWWGAQGNGTPSLLVQSAALTPTNNFSGALAQSPAWVVPFNCRLKSIIFKGFSNTGAGTVDLAFTSGTYLGSGSNLVNNTILSNQPFVIHNYLGTTNNSATLFVFDTGFANYTIPKGYEIRMFMNNRNVGINLLSTTIMIEFEEVL